MKTVYCAAWPTDKLSFYVTEEEKDDEPLFALIIENITVYKKMSVCLKHEDAITLRDELNRFIEAKE